MGEAKGIDIGLILQKKFGKAPRLLTWYLKRLIHQDFLNGFFVILFLIMQMMWIGQPEKEKDRHTEKESIDNM